MIASHPHMIIEATRRSGLIRTSDLAGEAADAGGDDANPPLGNRPGVNDGAARRDRRLRRTGLRPMVTRTPARVVGYGHVADDFLTCT